MQAVKVGILGLGTVGGGTVNLLTKNKQIISSRIGFDINLTHAADLSPPKDYAAAGVTLTTDAMTIVTNPDIKIVIELIGGIGIARDLVLAAIDHGKHVVTANKALIAVHGNELFARAAQKGVTIAFEAAVAGGIPIIKAIREGLAANNIEWLAGIINGTSNFILTEMRDKDHDFADALAQAQALGYAEADPAFDIEGIDAAHKLTIMASLAFGMPLKFDKVYTEGIGNLSSEDVKYATELGYCIKHLGMAKKTDDGVELRVHPTLIPHHHLIANIDGVMNAVLVKADVVGPTLYYGAGAGADATASAVVADIIDIARTLNSDTITKISPLAFQHNMLSDTLIVPITKVATAYYLRINSEDKPNMLAEIIAILADHAISIKAIVKKEPKQKSSILPVVILTQRAYEENIDVAISRIESLSTTSGLVMRIRVESLGCQ